MRKIASIIACIGLSACASPWSIGESINGNPLSFGTTGKLVTEINKQVLIQGEPLAPPKARQLADQLLNQSDINCQNYLTGVSWENNAISVALDFASLTLSTVSPITKPARSAGILSAGAAISGGTKQVLTSDILGGKDYGLIHDAVIDGRSAERKLIQADIEKGAFDAWTPESILSHMQPYHYDCGLEFGLKYLRETLANQAQKPPGATLADIAKSAATAAKTAAGQAVAATNANAAAQAAAGHDAAAAAISERAAVDAKAANASNADDLRKKADAEGEKAKASAALAVKTAKAELSATNASKLADAAADKATAAVDADTAAKAASVSADADAKAVAGLVPAPLKVAGP